MPEVCELDPFSKTKCYRDKAGFEVCLLCQLYWIRGLLYRLTLDFEAFSRTSTVDLTERIMKRELTDGERKLVEKLHREGRTLTEIVEELKRGEV